MRVNQIIETIQGEGRFAGIPVLLIRLSGCNLNCSWCDTKHDTFKEMDTEQVVQRIQKYKGNTILWTGGEPTLQLNEMNEVITTLENTYQHHIETNGTDMQARVSNLSHFRHIAVSPKDLKTAKQWAEKRDKFDTRISIKVVTDLKTLNKDLIPYADTLMPLTTGNPEDDLQIKKELFMYCKKRFHIYSPRLHVDIFPNRRL